jgi:uncharacterized protein (TIGR03435 family)
VKCIHLSLALAAIGIAVIVAAGPLLSQTSPSAKLSFDVISIKSAAPMAAGEFNIGGGPRGNRYTMRYATLRMLLQSAYQRPSTTPIASIQIVGTPNWIDSERYDIQATANCSSGALSREQIQFMVRSMLEDRFQLKAHMETREGQVYNLVVAKSPPKIKQSEDQTPIPQRGFAPLQPCSPVPERPANPAPPSIGPGQRGNPFDPNNPAPRGFLGMSFGPTGITLRGSAASISSMMGMLQIYAGRPIIDKTDLNGLFDFAIHFSQEGLFNPDGRPMASASTPIPAPGAPPPANTAADPLPSLFSAIQELGLKLESAKGPVEVLVIDSVSKPSEN